MRSRRNLFGSNRAPTKNPRCDSRTGFVSRVMRRIPWKMPCERAMERLGQEDVGIVLALAPCTRLARSPWLFSRFWSILHLSCRMGMSFGRWNFRRVIPRLRNCLGSGGTIRLPLRTWAIGGSPNRRSWKFLLLSSRRSPTTSSIRSIRSILPVTGFRWGRSILTIACGHILRPS